MWRRVIINAIVALIVLVCNIAWGQEGETSLYLPARNDLCDAIETGDRIRIGLNQGVDQDLMRSLDEGNTLTGTIVSCGKGALVFSPESSDEDSILVSLEEVEWLQVSQGRSSHALAGAAIGLVVGGLIGMGTQSGGSLDEMEESIATGAGIAVAGTFVGAMVGSLMGNEKWENVYGEWSVSLQGGNNMGEYQMAVDLSF